MKSDNSSQFELRDVSFWQVTAVNGAVLFVVVSLLLLLNYFYWHYQVGPGMNAQASEKAEKIDPPERMLREQFPSQRELSAQ